MQNINYLFDYYGFTAARHICHSVKSGNKAAIERMAEALTCLIRSTDIVVPMPNRYGEPGVMGTVCELIKTHVACALWETLKGLPRRSLYEMKQQGVKLNNDSVKFSLLRSSQPHKTRQGRIIIIDSVRDTGTTARAALKLINHAEVLCFAGVSSNRK